VHWGGEGKDIPSTASLRSFTERECCFNDGVCGGPVRAGPVLRVTFLFVCLFLNFILFYFIFLYMCTFFVVFYHPFGFVLCVFNRSVCL